MSVIYRILIVSIPIVKLIALLLILGVLASCIPFANHNQSPRNTYQAAMGKQAIGININKYQRRSMIPFPMFYPIHNVP